MSRNRIVRTSVTRINISDGDWIEVKNELNTGEAKALEAAGLKPPIMLNGRPFQPIDWAIYEQERALIFLAAWSLKDEKLQTTDQLIPLDFSGINSLDLESFEEINKAVFTHTVEQAKVKKAMRDAQMKEPEQPAKNLPNEPSSGSEVISS